MKRFTMLISLVITLTCLVIGCSHNAVTYSDGIGLETTINPETYTIGLSFRYGKILSAVVRENVKITMNGTGKVNGALSSGSETSSDNSAASNEGSLEIEIGNQVTGYLCDLAEIDKKLAEKIIDAKIKKGTQSTSVPESADNAAADKGVDALTAYLESASANSSNTGTGSDNKNDASDNGTATIDNAITSGTGTIATASDTAAKTDTSGTK
ncbi:MAG: hypothetical protein BWY31_02815 [Lentisphaerae bacterium ADurb.Bin242]|nr:MAG: hypothetical protein BWY31_02815 [Lentisphaerae bacterium ADurb.Bin242]